jgi:hypothetical protein
MIPYVIKQATPCHYYLYQNIESFFASSEKDEMNEHIIKYIINIMHKWYNEAMEYYEYQCDVSITSYNVFCEHYWSQVDVHKWENEELYAPMMRDWKNVFRVYYFENEWIEWNIEDYKEQIYISYINNYIFS